METNAFPTGKSGNNDNIAVAVANINDQVKVPVISAVQPAITGARIEPIPKIRSKSQQ